MATRLPNYQMRDGRTRLGQDYFNPIWADLDSRLDTLERIKLDWNAQVAQLRDLGLQRIDEYIRPVVDEVDALLAQATEETNGLAQELVNEHLQPLVDSANALLAQVQSDTDTLAQDLVDQHLQPKVDQANTLLAQAQQSADDLAAALDSFSTTASRNDPSTDTLLQAKAMNDHRQSGDHDGRYYRKVEIDTARQTHNQSGDHDGRYYRKVEIDTARQTHNQSGDHDARYYRKTQVDASISTGRYDLASATTTDTLDLAARQVFRVDADSNRTLSFSNAPGAERAMTVVIRITGSSGTITWPAGIEWAEGTAPELRAVWTAVVLLWDGATWRGFVSGGAD